MPLLPPCVAPQWQLQQLKRRQQQTSHVHICGLRGTLQCRVEAALHEAEMQFKERHAKSLEQHQTAAQVKSLSNAHRLSQDKQQLCAEY